MVSQEDLIRIGMDGFAIVDKYMETKGRQKPQGPSQGCLYQYQPQKSHIYQVKPVSAAEEIIVQFRDGVSIMDYSKGKPRAKAY